jgi:arylsulfatase B
VHVNVNATDNMAWDDSDPVSGQSGVPTEMSMVNAKLKQAGYATHYVGKWGVGWSRAGQMPLARGYDSFLGYLHDSNDFYTGTLDKASVEVPQGCEKHGVDGIVDLWRDDGPAGAPTAWEDFMFTNESVTLIARHDARRPLFLFHAFHSVHTPLRPPSSLESAYAHVLDPSRRAYAAMTAYVDRAVGEIKAALEAKGMWENTLLVVTSDNGGPTYPGKNTALFGSASNAPLRGGKTSDWEGGIRVTALAAGGLLPDARRGAQVDDYVHLADWYATFCALAGVDPHDERAASAGLPAVDSINMWPLLSGARGARGRSEIHISPVTLILGPYKLLTGADSGSINKHQQPGFVPFDSYLPGYGAAALVNSKMHRNCSAGCLFDILNDPSERVDLAPSRPDLVDKLWARLRELNKSVFNPRRGTFDGRSLAQCKRLRAEGNTYHAFLCNDAREPARPDALRADLLGATADIM